MSLGVVAWTGGAEVTALNRAAPIDTCGCSASKAAVATSSGPCHAIGGAGSIARPFGHNITARTPAQPAATTNRNVTGPILIRLDRLGKAMVRLVPDQRRTAGQPKIRLERPSRGRHR